MTIEDLHRTVVDGFKSVDERFARIDERFARIDERFTGIDGEFVKVRGEMGELRTLIDVRLGAHEETMRRHFDVMVEKVEAAVRIVAEGYGHLRTVADDHESRLQALEKHS